MCSVLSRMFQEATYWQDMGFDCPLSMNEINTYRDSLELLKKHIGQLVQEYNRSD
jgi:hypothetical protein